MGKLAPLAIRALAAGLRKHGVTKERDLQVIAKRAMARRATDVASLHAWARDGADLSARLQQIIVKLTTIPCPAIADYPLLSHLASGGMGSVYLSADRQERLVVVKVLKQTRLGDEQFVKRFLRETAMTQRIQDKYVVRCLDSGADESGQCYLVLEYVPGGDLHHLIRRSKTLDEKQALTLLYQMARGLMAAEAEGIIHRDLKPANIFIHPNGLAKIGDFGLARTTNEERTMLTLDGTIMGTPGFMSPEQIRADENIDIRSDVYALGVIAFNMLCGRPPFQGDPSSILRQHLYDPPPDIRTLCSSLHSRTVKTIVKCLAKDPRDRFQSARTLAASVKKTIQAIGFLSQATLDEHTIVQAQVVDEEAEVVTNDPPAPANDGAEPAYNSAVVGGPMVSATVTTPATPMQAPPVTVQTMPENPTDQPQDDEAELTLDGDLTLIGDEAPVVNWQGRLEDALADDWLTLHPATGQAGPTILLYARTRLTFGKLRTPPVDVCLRVYPLETEREACQRISRTHWQLDYDSARYQIQAMDLGSANGLTINGRIVNPHQPWPLEVSTTHDIAIPNALTLQLAVFPQRSPQNRQLVPGSAPGPVGIDSEMAIDGVVITRPSNRSDLVFAQVLRSLSFGPDADCPVPELGHCEIARYATRWIIRDHPTNPWRPLSDGMSLPGSKWVVRRGDWADYQ